MIYFPTSAPVSSQHKAICGDFTGVLASLETLPSSQTNRGCCYKSSRKSQTAVVAVEELAVMTRRVDRIHVASLQDRTRDPRAPRGVAQAESSLVAELALPTHIIYSQLLSPQTNNKLEGKGKESFSLAVSHRPLNKSERVLLRFCICL